MNAGVYEVRNLIDIRVEPFVTPDRNREFLRANLYIIVGLLAGLGIGIAVGSQFRDFVLSNGWPKESVSWIVMSLIYVSILLNAFLYQGWKKINAQESDMNPTLQSESK